MRNLHWQHSTLRGQRSINNVHTFRHVATITYNNNPNRVWILMTVKLLELCHMVIIQY